MVRLRKKVVILSWVLFFILVFSLGLAGEFIFSQPIRQQIIQWQTAKKDKYVVFSLEIYDKIKDNYWDKITDEQLSSLFKSAAEKLTANKQTISLLDKNGVGQMLEQILKNKSDKGKKDFTVKLANMVLANLNPFGRSGLYTSKDEQNLKNRVNNVDTSVDLYKILTVKKSDTTEKIKDAYEEKSSSLTKIISDANIPQPTRDQAKSQLNQLSRAYDTLAQPEKKDNYDKTGAEATANYKIMDTDILYIKMKQISPATSEEFKQVIVNNSNKDLNYLIIDLRGNFGGAIDSLTDFLGYFIGKNQYAFEFYHKADFIPLRTRTDYLLGLAKFKKIVILTDNQMQSSAEVLAAVFKKYKLGILVGTATKGWGTVERVFNLDTQIDKSEKYSIFLVHSLTVRDDIQPIEGRGVEPNININNRNWQEELNAQVNNSRAIQVIDNLLE